MRAAYPGYNGARPRIQLWHGTADDTLRYPNFNEAIELWINIHGVSQTPTYTDSPQSGATRTRYGSVGNQAQVEAISLQGTGHNLPVNAAEAIRFFGLTTTASSGVASSARSATPTSSASSSIARSSIASSSVASSVVNSGNQCNWYSTRYPLCLNTASGWGYESNRSCISRITCSTQPTPYGVVEGNTSLPSSSADPIIIVIDSSSSAPASSTPASSARSSAVSSISNGQVCNWWGTRYPLCAIAQNGWGWENQTNCISRRTCSTQPAPYGVAN